MISKPKYLPLAKAYIKAAYFISPAAGWTRSFPFLVCKVREFLNKHPRLWKRFPEIAKGDVKALLKDYRVTENLEEE